MRPRKSSGVGAEDDPIDLISSDDGSPAPPPVTSSARLRKERAYIPNITDDSGSASEVNLLRNLLPGVQAAKERAAKQAAQEASRNRVQVKQSASTTNTPAKDKGKGQATIDNEEQRRFGAYFHNTPSSSSRPAKVLDLTQDTDSDSPAADVGKGKGKGKGRTVDSESRKRPRQSSTASPRKRPVPNRDSSPSDSDDPPPPRRRHIGFQRLALAAVDAMFHESVGPGSWSHPVPMGGHNPAPRQPPSEPAPVRGPKPGSWGNFEPLVLPIKKRDAPETSGPEGSSPPPSHPEKKKVVARKSVGGRAPRPVKSDVAKVPVLPPPSPPKVAPAPVRTGPSWRVHSPTPVVSSSSQSAPVTATDLEEPPMDEPRMDFTTSPVEDFADSDDVEVDNGLDFGDAGGLDDELPSEPIAAPNASTANTLDQMPEPSDVPRTSDLSPAPPTATVGTTATRSRSSSTSSSSDMSALARLDWDDNRAGHSEAGFSEASGPSRDPLNIISEDDGPAAALHGSGSEAEEPIESPPAGRKAAYSPPIAEAQAHKSRSESSDSNMEAVQTPAALKQHDPVVMSPTAEVDSSFPPIVVDRLEVRRIIAEVQAPPEVNKILSGWSASSCKVAPIVTSRAPDEEQPPPGRRGVAKRSIDHEIVDEWNGRLTKLTNNGDLHCAIFEAYIGWATSTDEPFAPEIKVVNKIDAHGGPPKLEFQYSNEMLYHPDVPDPEMGLGCGCEGPCDPESKTCTCRKRQELYLYGYNEGFNYASDGRVRQPDCPIWECGPACGCPPECMNRVIQRGRDKGMKLEIFQTGKCGWGVKTNSYIPQGQFIGIYAGEVITDAESERRGHTYEKLGRTYLFDFDGYSIGNPPPEGWMEGKPPPKERLEDFDPRAAQLVREEAKRIQQAKENGEDNPSSYSVDAFHYGFTRFINHSCDPNVLITSAYVKDFHPARPLLVMFARRPIMAGDELCISYKGIEDDDDALQALPRPHSVPPEAAHSGGGGGGRRAAKSKTTALAHVTPSKGQTVPSHAECHCGSIKCNGYMFGSGPD